MFKMAEPSDFNDMNLEEHKKYLQECGVSVSGYLKTSLVEVAEIASAVERMVSFFRLNDADKLIIHDMVIKSQSIFPA